VSQIASLDVSSLTNLIRFLCYSNQIANLDVSNSTNLTHLICNQNQLQSLNISGLTNLRTLDCKNNQLTSLDVSNLINLTSLICYNNQITGLDVSNLTNLIQLNCESNQIPNLNVSNLTNLTYLFCYGNQIANLDVSNLTNLIQLNCESNQIPNLNVSNLTNLTLLHCNSNQIASLDVSNLINLTSISCSYNNITNLDVSNLTNLTELLCHNNPLTSVDISNSHQLTSFVCGSLELNTIFMKNGRSETLILVTSPNLQYVCADENQVSSIQSQVGANVVVSSYCNFTPGGSFNTVTGTVRFDIDNNGCSNTDSALPNSVHLNITDGTVASGTFPTTDGSYLLYTLTGTNTLSTSLENPSYFNIDPTATTITTTTLGNTQTQDFCITANGVHNEVEVVIVPLTTARPGFDATYKIVYRNKGNQTESGNIVFTYDDAVLDYVSSTATPSATAVGSLTWDYNNLLPFESRSFTVTLNANAPTETPPVNISDILNFTATINPVSGDELPNDNTFAYSQTVVGSYDPNDKTCLEGEVVTPTKIGDYLHYNINFENTGTAPAENVVVKDVIDTTKFDINTLQIMDSSNPVMTKITGNVVEFIFQNINLGASVHGNVVFKIKTKTSLTTGSNVTNTANIYFDYNAPVTTNTATTTFQSLANDGFVIDNSVKVYPNPAKNNININCNSTIKSMQLFDVQGRLLTVKLVNETQSNLDISSYANGVYFIKILSEKGQKTEKIIKE
jgi:uncharacterized repeat protein (TIGR01451 family)